MLTSDLVVNVRLSLALGRPGLAWRNLLKSVDSRPQEPEAANSSLGHWGLGHSGLGMVWYGMVWVWTPDLRRQRRPTPPWATGGSDTQVWYGMVWYGSVDSRPQEPEAANSTLGHWGLGHTGLGTCNI